MSSASAIRAMRAAGIPADQILDAILAMEEERLAKGRARTAKCRNNKDDSDVTNVTRVTPLPLEGSSPTPPSPKTLTPIPPSPPKGGSSPKGSDRFEDFWRAYPKRKGENPRKPAEQKFIAAVKRGADPSDIIAGAEHYAAACRADGQWDTPYVAQAVTWLNQERWQDYASGTTQHSDPAVMEAIRYQIEQSIKHGDVSEAQIQFYRQHFGEPDVVDREVQDADVGDVHGGPTGRVQSTEVGSSPRDGDGSVQGAAGLDRVFPVDAVFSGAARNTTDRARGAFARQRG